MHTSKQPSNLCFDNNNKARANQQGLLVDDSEQKQEEREQENEASRAKNQSYVDMQGRQ